MKKDSIPLGELIACDHTTSNQSLEQSGELLSVFVFLFQNEIDKEHDEVGVELGGAQVTNALSSFGSITYTSKRKYIESKPAK